MTTAGRAYVVRDADGGSGEVTQVYAYTLKGLTTALEDARFRSFHGVPQAVVVIRDGRSEVIRRFESGHEVPQPSLPHPRQPTGLFPGPAGPASPASHSPPAQGPFPGPTSPPVPPAPPAHEPFPGHAGPASHEPFPGRSSPDYQMRHRVP